MNAYLGAVFKMSRFDYDTNIMSIIWVMIYSFLSHSYNHLQSCFTATHLYFTTYYLSASAPSLIEKTQMLIRKFAAKSQIQKVTRRNLCETSCLGALVAGNVNTFQLLLHSLSLCDVGNAIDALKKYISVQRQSSARVLL